jgi:hypothetical protein
MQVIKLKLLFFILAALCMSLSQPQDARSAMSALLRANNEGLYISYNLEPLYAGKEVTLAPGDPLVEVFAINGIIKAEMGVTEITTEPNKVTVSLVLSGTMIGQQPTSMLIPVPFGEYGAYVDFMGREFISLMNHEIEASALLTRLKTDYAITCAMEPLFSGHWEGMATPADNTIHEMILSPIDNSTVADITLMLKYGSPFFTRIEYSVVLNPPASFSNALNGMEKTLEPISGTIMVPNGTYHIWADPDIAGSTADW